MSETPGRNAKLPLTQMPIAAAFDMLPMPAFIKDPELVITHANPAYCAFVGRREDEIVGSAASQVSPLDWRWQEATDRKLLQSGGVASYELNLRRPGQAPVRGEVFKVRLDDPFGSPAGVLTVIIDRSRRFDAEQLLLESQTLHKLVVESISDAVLMLDEGLRFTFVGPTTMDIFGRDAQEMLRIGAIDAVVESAGRPFRDLPRDRETRNLECSTRRPDGVRRELLVNVKPIAVGAGRWLLSCRDVTDQVETTARLKNSMLQTVRALCATVEKRDPYVVGHQDRVAELAVAIGRRMGLDEHRVEGLRLAAIIHDIGKVIVPSEILNKPGRLSGPEFEIIKGHVDAGYDILKDIDFPWPVARMVREHHEAIDGSGYPLGLTGDCLLLESRILSVADILEAVTSHRPYRAGLGVGKALAILRQMRGAKLDPDVVDVCIALVEGNEVDLSGWTVE